MTESQISAAVQALRSARTNDEFQVTVKAIIGDRKLKNADLDQISREYGGSSAPAKNRKSFGDFWQSRRLENQRQQGLGQTIDRMYGRQTVVSEAGAHTPYTPASKPKTATSASAKPSKASEARLAASAEYEKAFGKPPSARMSAAAMQKEVQKYASIKARDQAKSAAISQYLGSPVQKQPADKPAPPPKPKKAAVSAAPAPHVAEMADNLKKALGTAQFGQVRKQMETWSANDVKAVARLFTAGAPRSGAEALKRIDARNHALMVSQMKSASRAGRSAGAVLGPLAAVAAGALAFDAAQTEASASGATSSEALAKGAAAAVPAVAVAAGAGWAIGKGLQAAAVLLPKVAPALGPVGLVVAAGTTAYGAVEGYRKTGTIAGAAFGALTMGEVPESMKPPASAPEASGAYLNDAAQRKAEATPMQAPAPTAGSQTAAPSADGETAGYVATRRTASGTIQVQVGSYKTPGR